jgi:hypothetical protein
MNIVATITSALGSLELPAIEVPLTKSRVDMTTDIVTLGNDIYTDFSPNRRRQWEFPYSWMYEDIYEAIEAVYDSQFTTGDYPTISIPYYGVEDVPVRMFLNDMEVIDDCGTIQGIKLSFRETSQQPESS